MSIGLSVARVCVALPLCLALHLALLGSVQADLLVDFEDITLAPNSYLKGPAPGAVGVDGVQKVGQYMSRGVGFSNTYSYFQNPTYESWDGFAISSMTDATTAGVGNQFSSFAGSGADGSSNYGIAYVNGWRPEMSGVDDLRQLPSIYLPPNMQVQSAMFSNTTYAAFSMKDGDFFADAFTEGDYFRLSVFGIGANDQVLGSSVDLMLADYRDGAKFILGGWETLDLTSLAGAQSLHFDLSSKVDPRAMQHPTYFAMDNLTLSAVPEPSGLLLLTCMGLGLAFRRSRASN